MTQEQKDLLLVDISARLPYGVKVKTDNVFPQKLEGISFDKDTFIYWVSDGGYTLDSMGCKPYLFPMPSMTEEQKEEYCQLQQKIIYNSKGFVNTDIINYINWCYKNHLDVNGLIPLDLAIDATNKNIY